MARIYRKLGLVKRTKKSLKKARKGKLKPKDGVTHTPKMLKEKIKKHRKTARRKIKSTKKVARKVRKKLKASGTPLSSKGKKRQRKAVRKRIKDIKGHYIKGK